MRWPLPTEDPDGPIGFNAWWAWHPVRIGDEWVWWEWVERRTAYDANLRDGLPIPTSGRYQYRDGAPWDDGHGDSWPPQ